MFFLKKTFSSYPAVHVKCKYSLKCHTLTLANYLYLCKQFVARHGSPTSGPPAIKNQGQVKKGSGCMTKEGWGNGLALVIRFNG